MSAAPGATAAATALAAEGIVAGYGPADEILKGVDLAVSPGEIVAALK